MTHLYYDISPEQWPIVYDPGYNIYLGGIEKMHPFDSTKWKNIVEHLINKCMVRAETLVKPREPTTDDLLVVHTKRYLKSLKWSYKVAMVTEIVPVAFVPNFILQRAYLKPMRLQTGGSILAGKLATERGWAINIGGGLHHCSSDKGGGFCVYADIQLLIRFLLNNNVISTAMIVDLDAHQGNGYARDFIHCAEVYIMDMYNKSIYPHDTEARKAINRPVPLKPYTKDSEYLNKLRKNLPYALQDFHPDILVYNAGTDVLENDPLGHLSISGKGIIQRDEYVFQTCIDKRIPIVMLTSGGYVKSTAKIIAESILNLYDKGIIRLR